MIYPPPTDPTIATTSAQTPTNWTTTQEETQPPAGGISLPIIASGIVAVAVIVGIVVVLVIVGVVLMR